MTLDCPVCPLTQIAEDSCPQCGTDLKPLLRLAELRAESQKPREQPPVVVERVVEQVPARTQPWLAIAAFVVGLAVVPGWQKLNPPPKIVETVIKEVPAPVPAPVEKMYTVRNGESFWSIAREKYGMGEMWKTIRDDNKDRLRKHGRLMAGEAIRLRTVTISPK